MLALLASVLPVRGAQAVLRDDTYVDFSNPTQSFGALPRMLVDSGPQNPAVSFVRFDLSNLPADTVSSQVARSTLRLWVVSVNTPATVTVEAVGGEWQEGKVTAITRPFIAQGAAVPPPVSVPVANASQWVLIDVTTVVKAWIDRTLPNDGLALTASAGSVSLGTKESSSSGQAVLEIILTGSPIAAADPPRADASIHPTSATVPTGAARSKGTEGSETPQRTQSALSLPVTGARVIEYAAAKCQAGAAATGFNLPSLNAPAALCDANDGRAVLSFKPGNTVNPESLILTAAPSSITALIRGRGATPGTAVWRLRYVCSSPGQTSSPVLANSVTASMTVVSSPARAESEAEMAVSPAGCVA